VICLFFYPLYVDDIIITTTLSHAISYFISMICNSYALKDLGTLHYFFGVEVSWTKDGYIHLYQSRYIKDLLAHTNMLDYKPQSTSVISFLHLTQDVSTVVLYPTVYHSVVKALQYILIT